MFSGLKEFKADFSPIDKKIAIVASEFNRHITDMLYTASVQTLLDRGVRAENIFVYWVPGAFEIPLTCKKIFDKGNCDGIITLGAVIRGETPHFDHVAGNYVRGILRVSIDHGKPIIFGVLTTDTVEQALARSGLKSGNKGSEAAHSLLNLFSIYEKSGI